MLFFSHYPLTFNNIKSEDNFSLSFYYQYSWGITTESMMKNFTIASLFLYAPFFLVILYRTKQLFEKIAQGTPVFDSQIVQQLQKISFWLYVYPLAPMIINPFLSALFTQSLEIKISLNTSLLFAIGVSLLLEVFKYGATLQYEVDETV